MTTDFVGLGLAFPLRTKANGSLETIGGVANVEKAMRIILLTYLGERPMRPNFGSRLRDFMFEPVTDPTATALKVEVTRAITACEPRVVVDDVVVVPDEGAARFDIEIRYTLLENNHPYNLVFPFYAIPGEDD